MAFPTTSILDDFNRADASPAGGNWTTAIFFTDVDFRIVGNQLAKVASGVWGSAYYSAATYTNVENSVTVATNTANSKGLEAVVRIQNPGGGSVNNYFVHIQKLAGTDTIQLWKTVANVQTQLGSDASQEFAAGDLIGIEANGTTITCWYKPAAGSWTSLISVTDSAVAGAGYIGFAGEDATFRLDDCRAGTIIGGGTTTTLTPGAGSLALTGRTPALKLAIPVAKATLALTGLTPKLKFTLAVPKATLSLTGFAPSILNGVIVSPAKGTLAFTGLAPSLKLAIAVPKATLSLSGFAPSLKLAVPVLPASLTFSGFAPSLKHAIGIPTAALGITGYAPSVSATHHVTLRPAAGVLTLLGFAPVVSGGVPIATPGIEITGRFGMIESAGNFATEESAGTFAATIPLRGQV